MKSSYECMKSGKLKKEIKWYTYVDSHLNSKLQDFMEEYTIKNQAKIIRNFVNYGIDYFKEMIHKNTHITQYDEIKLDTLIRKAIDAFEIGNNFQEELKQKISPLKLSLLVLNNYVEGNEEFSENIQNAIKALEDLELTVKHHFEEPNIIRFVKKIDLLYIEDNELERKTVENYYKFNGLNVKAVETSDEALYLLKNLTPRVILLDLNLKTSNLDGVKFCQMLKSSSKFSGIPIILISAVYSENEKAKVIASSGADDIIFKPIDKLKELDLLFKYLKN
ncbi:MAG: PleD family two-component system response regulator, partial [Promethearchaeota archaeon]